MSCYDIEPDPFPAPPPATTSVFAAASTDPGLERAENQDRAVIGDAATDQSFEPPATVGLLVGPSGSFFAAVFDGMGGEAGGALASHLAAETVVADVRARFAARVGEPSGSVAHVARGLAASLEAGAARIKRAARAEPHYARMGTTATLATIADGALVVAQIGDSRAYVLRHGVLHQVTEDQTVLNMLLKAGDLLPEQIRALVGPNVILQALGSSTRLEVALTRTPLAQGDLVLLCSDGLYGVVDDAAIAAVLLATPDLGDACNVLVQHANRNGGPDNITCVAFRVVDDALPPPSTTPPLTTTF